MEACPFYFECLTTVLLFVRISRLSSMMPTYVYLCTVIYISIQISIFWIRAEVGSTPICQNDRFWITCFYVPYLSPVFQTVQLPRCLSNFACFFVGTIRLPLIIDSTIIYTGLFTSCMYTVCHMMIRHALFPLITTAYVISVAKTERIELFSWLLVMLLNTN